MARSRNLNTAARRRRRLASAARIREEEATRNLELSLFGEDDIAGLLPNNNPTNFEDAFPPAAPAAYADDAAPPAPPAPLPAAPLQEEEPVYMDL
jgi:hypothetical protein